MFSENCASGTSTVWGASSPLRMATQFDCVTGHTDATLVGEPPKPAASHPEPTSADARRPGGSGVTLEPPLATGALGPPGASWTPGAGRWDRGAILVGDPEASVMDDGPLDHEGKPLHLGNVARHWSPFRA